jgi:crotonobetainyl-CoA:carnitine CoA-transferase CaiB-like acyl-CoA transferase
MRALQDICVIDLSRVLAGPLCTQILGDLGADIIKIERPGAGDDTRQWGPPFLKDKEGNDTTESAYYLSANRNKRSLAVDITKPEGQEIIHALLAKADVLIQNFKTGGLEKYGLGYEQVRERHQHIVYCAITGFGSQGPLAQEPGYDFVAQAMAGLMAVTGEPGGEPMKAGVALSDVMTGLYGVIGILAALRAREKTGKGQLVDLALTDCTLAGMVNIAQYYLTSGKLAPRLGNAHSTIVPYQVFRTADGYVIIAVGNDSQFRKFAEFLKQGWADDPRFAVNQNRVRNRDILIPLIEPLIAKQTTGYWVKNLHESDVPAGPVNTMDQVFAMEQTKIRGMEIVMNHPLAAEPVHLIGSPLKLSDTPATYRRPPPFMGQHTDEILKNVLDLDDAAIQALRKNKVI